MKHRIVDSHTHLWDTTSIDTHMQTAAICDHAAIGIACTIDPDTINANPQGFACKAKYPENVFVFAGLDHTTHPTTPTLANQVRTLKDIGVDGIKLIESKPTSRNHVSYPMDSIYYDDFFRTVEELDIPLIWHVADPEEFWNPAQLPQWAREKGWGYGDTDIEKEALYSEVEHVLNKHPGLRATFAHFYFLSADIKRAEDFLHRHPNIQIDLAPGVEMLYNISRNPEEGREFFTSFADRIIYGTDMFSSLSADEAKARSGMVRRWLETTEEFTVGQDADFLLGKPEDGVIHGMGLADETLAKIYRGNFSRLCGEKPVNLDVDRAIVECERIRKTAPIKDKAQHALEVLQSVR